MIFLIKILEKFLRKKQSKNNQIKSRNKFYNKKIKKINRLKKKHKNKLKNQLKNKFNFFNMVFPRKKTAHFKFQQIAKILKFLSTREFYFLKKEFDFN